MDDADATLRLDVEGMDCASCATKIEGALKRVPEVAGVAVNVGAGTVTVRGRGEVAPPAAAVRDAVRRLGYRVLEPAAATRARVTAPGDHEGHDHADGHDRDHGAPLRGPWWQSAKGRLVIVTAVLLAVAFVIDRALPAVGDWAYLPAMLVGLVPVAQRAFGAARASMFFTIEMLMTIAAAGALAIGAVSEASVVVFLFAVGELLEGVAAQRARASISALADLTPKTARLVEGDAVREVPAAGLRPGQVVLVRPGDRVPADGRIVAGRSSLDEAPVTGESVPRAKGEGEDVFAGSINAEAALRVEVTREAADNTIARIVRLVEEAQEAKAPTQRFIDRFSRWYMPLAVVIALLVAVVPPLALGAPWDTWIYRALAVLLIACPCALVISTPAAIAAGLAAGARRGLLVKGGAVLETLAGIKQAAFDKTGTLTAGRPVVTDVEGLTATPAEFLALAAALETGSSHPVARAVLDRAAADGIVVPSAEDGVAVAGKGVSGRVAGRELFLGSPRAVAEVLPEAARARVEALEAEGKTVVLLREGDRVLGLLAARDEPREDAKVGLAELRRLGVAGVMLTGDNRRTAEAIARELGIEARAELMPEDKARIVGELRAGGPVAKVGDGINDAPALAAADVGIAMGGGTDVALETGDAALLSNRVTGVSELVALARATMANIHQNVALSLGLKAVLLVTSVAGVTGLWPAILADTGATVLVTMNALRLLRFRFDRG